MNKLLKRNNKKGFTLAELLIVMAIISIMVAIMFPVFSGAMHKAHVATVSANIRSKTAEIIADKLLDNSFNGSIVINKSDLTALASDYSCVSIDTGTAHKIIVKDGEYTQEIQLDDDVTVN